MSVLIGGGSGFVGRHLTKLLCENGMKVTVLSRAAGPNRITWAALRRAWSTTCAVPRLSCSMRLQTRAMSGTPVAGNADLVVKHDQDNSEFNVTTAQGHAVLRYEYLADGSVDLYTTRVPLAFRGRGIAALLAQAALDHFAAQETSMLLTCSYLQEFHRENPQAAHVDFILPY